MYYFTLTGPISDTITIATATSAVAHEKHDEGKTLVPAGTFFRTICRGSDIPTFEAAEKLAGLLGAEWIATDAGPSVSPRYDVIALPKVGTDVSYAFNGDYYPAGKITKRSAGPAFRRIEATDEKGSKSVFYRLRKTGCWKMNGTWSLVSGTINKRNPEF